MIFPRSLCLLLGATLCACGAPDGWRDPVLPEGSSAPHLASAPDGTAVLSYLAPQAVGTQLGFVVLDGSGWSQPRQVAAGERWFVNWADFPSVVPLTAARWAAHWLVRSADDPYAYEVRVAVSGDGGRSWSPGVTVHTDGTPTEHGFVSLYPAADGVGVLWLDGRELASDPDGATQLFSAVVRGPDLAVVGERPLDGRVCDCCRTDVALTEDGPVAVYRDRSPDEIRDIAVSRWRPVGWEPGRIVAADGWRITGCPVNGPAVAARGNRLAVAWYTAQPNRRVAVAFSRDGAATFGPPVDVQAREPLGRVDVALLDSGDAVVSWLEAVPGRLMFRQVAADGSLGPAREVARVSPERNAGFPQMIRTDEWLVFAWTDVQANRIRTRRLPLTP